MDDDDDAGCCDAVRTYDCFMPHCRCMGDGGLTMVLHLVHFFVGGSVSSPATSPSRTAVWDLLHFPLAVPPVPPRYTFPNSSLNSCLAQTSNVVHASLAVPLLKNFHLSHNQTAAVRSLVGPNLGSLVRPAEFAWGKQDLLKLCQPFFCSHLQGGGLALDSGNVLGC